MVIAIIALLVGLLLPALSGARVSARTVTCGSQQRQVAVAIGSYANSAKDYWHAVWDNDALRFRPLFAGRNYLLKPFTVDAQRNLQETQAYWASLYDELLGVQVSPEMYETTGGIGDRTYLAGWEQTRCPEAKFTLKAFRNNGALAHDPYTLYSTYCFNGVTPGFDNVPSTVTRTFFERTPSGGRRPRPLGQIQFPSSIIMFQDGSEVVIDGNGDTLVQLNQWDGEPPPDNVQWEKEYFRHAGACSVTWADGHVSIITRADAAAKRAQLQSVWGAVSGVALPWYSTPDVERRR